MKRLRLDGDAMSDGERMIGGLKVIRLLGKGGMSEVYECEDPRLGSRHAVKLFTYEGGDEDVRSRFETEGRLLAKLSHPRIVRVTDFGTDGENGRPYFVMDRIVDGRGQVRSLAGVQPGTATEDEIGRWYDDLREGLAYIHANGVIHRDLKLQNVLIGPDGHVVLTDFGISKVFAAQKDGIPLVDTVNTIVKMREGRSLVMGSIGYMAPELEMGVAASKQSDWYALGVIVYRLLTGTWCDARTDVMGTLETYDPVWKRIIPKLLHANPQGRECLSYEEEKRIDREKAEFEWEEKCLDAQTKVRKAGRWIRWCGVGAAVLFVSLVLALVMGGMMLKRGADRESMLRTKLQVPTFDDVFVIPSDGSAANGIFQGESGTLALIDAWVLTHGLFRDLHAGVMTAQAVAERLSALAKKAEQDDMNLFDVNSRYSQVGEMEPLAVIMRNAAAKMRDYVKSGK